MATPAQYLGTGKRKTSVARVILLPGDGATWFNGRPLEEYFPRQTHRHMVMAPLRTAGAEGTYDIRVRVHGGGPSGQAGAVRHGIAPRAGGEGDKGGEGEVFHDAKDEGQIGARARVAPARVGTRRRREARVIAPTAVAEATIPATSTAVSISWAGMPAIWQPYPVPRVLSMTERVGNSRYFMEENVEEAGLMAMELAVQR